VFLTAAAQRADAFRRSLRHLRSQQQGRLDHILSTQAAMGRELAEGQEVEARHQRLAQELQARSLPPAVAPLFLRVCEVAARQLRDAQAARARQLTEVQTLEQLHAAAAFDRGLRMAEDRQTMEAQVRRRRGR
jgi:hypothetical protein